MFITARIASVFISSAAVHIYDLHIYKTLECTESLQNSDLNDELARVLFRLHTYDLVDIGAFHGCP